MLKIIRTDNVGNMYVNDVVVAMVTNLEIARKMIEKMNEGENNEYYYEIVDEDYEMYKF